MPAEVRVTIASPLWSARAAAIHKPLSAGARDGRTHFPATRLELADSEAAVTEALGYGSTHAEPGWQTGVLQRVDGGLVGTLHTGALKATEHNLDAAARAQTAQLAMMRSYSFANAGLAGGQLRLPHGAWGHSAGRTSSRRTEQDFRGMLDTPVRRDCSVRALVCCAHARDAAHRAAPRALRARSTMSSPRRSVASFTPRLCTRR